MIFIDPYISATSSSVYRGKSAYQASVAWIGRSLVGQGGFFISEIERNPWIRFKLKPTLLTAIVVINRWDCCGQMFRNIVVRGGVQKNDNQVLGKFEGPGKSKEKYKIPFNRVVKVVFLTIMRNEYAHLVVNGITTMNEGT